MITRSKRSPDVPSPAGLVAGDAVHRGSQPDVIEHRRGQRLDVPGGATLDGSPLRPVAEAQQPVAIKETRHGRGWELPEAGGIGRPDR